MEEAGKAVYTEDQGPGVGIGIIACRFCHRYRDFFTNSMI